MLNVEYRQAITQVLDILDNTDESLVKKIPNKFMDFLKQNKDYETKFYELGDGISITRKRWFMNIIVSLDKNKWVLRLNGQHKGINIKKTIRNKNDINAFVDGLDTPDKIQEQFKTTRQWMN